MGILTTFSIIKKEIPCSKERLTITYRTTTKPPAMPSLSPEPDKLAKLTPSANSVSRSKVS
nr:MAG TPA: hypothetical protein [Caudoviricetes sp.]